MVPKLGTFIKLISSYSLRPLERTLFQLIQTICSNSILTYVFWPNTAQIGKIEPHPPKLGRKDL